MKWHDKDWDEYCKKCGNIVEGEDAKGNGVSISFWCDECEEECEVE